MTSRRIPVKTCFLFPGQGAQYPGMAKDFYDTSSSVRTLFELASDAAGIDLKKLLFESDDATLKQTRNTQLAVALGGAVAALSATEHGIVPKGCAGFSVGEWPALATAGVLRLFDMFKLVSERGRLMDEAGKRSGGSTMSAVLFLSPEAIEKTITDAGLTNVWIANYNSPSQCVISGTEKEIAIVEEKLKEAGAKRVIRLKVSGAFHSPIMADARAGFAELLKEVTFSDPTISIYSNVTGKRIATAREAKELASMQIVSPVRWIAEENAISADGFSHCVETGPGTVLAGLWKASGLPGSCLAGGTLDAIASISL
jgi:[acyl-carrier-protein] S-malonyltransferase